MGRPPRQHVQGAFYHVTLRGNDRQPIFFGHDDRQCFERLLTTATQEAGATVHAYCWMTNHAHLLVRVDQIPLSAIMHRLVPTYSRRVQRRLQRSGHLFERRYGAVLVTSDRQLLATLRYIHLNPVEARLVKDPIEFRWCSHSDYVGRRYTPWVRTDFLWALLGSSRPVAIAAYRALLCTQQSEDETPPANLESIADETCARFNTRITELQTGSRIGQLRDARAWLANAAVASGASSITEVARLLGRNESTIRRILARRRPIGGK